LGFFTPLGNRPIQSEVSQRHFSLPVLAGFPARTDNSIAGFAQLYSADHRPKLCYLLPFFAGPAATLLAPDPRQL